MMTRLDSSSNHLTSALVSAAASPCHAFVLSRRLLLAIGSVFSRRSVRALSVLSRRLLLATTTRLVCSARLTTTRLVCAARRTDRSRKIQISTMRTVPRRLCTSDATYRTVSRHARLCGHQYHCVAYLPNKADDIDLSADSAPCVTLRPTHDPYMFVVWRCANVSTYSLHFDNT